MELENIMNAHVTEISKDDDLLSLFGRVESVVGNVPPQPQIEEIMDFQFNEKEIKRGYNSDEEIYIKRDRIIRSRQIVNKKQMRKKKKRSKIYIKALQNKVTQLQTQIQRLKKLNKINKEYIHRLNESEHVINGYFVGRQQVIEKLEVLNGEERVDNTKILQQIASLRLRQGVFGKDRIKAVNYYFRQMVEMVLPEIQKYVIKTAIQKQDFFDVNYLRTGIPAHNVQSWRKAMLENIGDEIKEKNAKEYLYNNRENIMKETKKFNDILVELGKLKCSLTEQAKKLQQVLDSAHKFMRPVEVSKSLCYIDKYRFEKNISLEHTFRQVFEQIESKCHSYVNNKPFCLQT